MASITALTIQSTQGVRKVIGLDPGTVTETLECLAEDVRFDAIKVGMLGDGAVAAAVMGWLEGQKNVPVVLDPVMKSSSGKDLLDPEGCEILRREGLVRANWITPNLAELAALAGREHSGKWRRNGESCARASSNGRQPGKSNAEDCCDWRPCENAGRSVAGRRKVLLVSWGKG